MIACTRRDFLRRSAVGAGALILGGRLAGRTGRAAERTLFSALGVCTGIENAAKVKEAGGGYIEGGVGGVLMPQKPDGEWEPVLAKLKAAPLPVPACNGFIPGNLKSTGPNADHDAVLAYAEVAFRRAQQAGVGIIVFGSSGSRKLPDGFPREKGLEQFTALLARMAPQAATHGVTVAIEPLNTKEDNLINPITDGAAVARAVGHPNVKIIADIFHMLRNGEPPDNIRACRDVLVHCHIAEKEGRTAPGVKGDDFRPYFKALADIGYAGRISIEGSWKIEQLAAAFAAMRTQAAEALG